ncbi:hypothetical protein JAAARDRAFT_161650 [Jaapia argillacea MUCL 33604]|uniref:SEC7 domain-containing protein n=1 Tax=Jaapia argillacea MUCL 33604 TaxID=933084 RepID=A0A067PT77_9AGAM|nr:hypothetical protein JAAARDRAFT_161650 [Jaapia argillacea MUCL 33604]
MEQQSAAERRAVAVAMLKRAASLPRMADGRRPPMREAVSEGEPPPDDDKGDEDGEVEVGDTVEMEGVEGVVEDSTPQVPSSESNPEDPEVEAQPEMEQAPGQEAEQEKTPTTEQGLGQTQQELVQAQDQTQEQGQEQESEQGQDEEREKATPQPSTSKRRRSRSRSRSRASKDLKGKMRATPSPGPQTLGLTSDSSADEARAQSPFLPPHLSPPQLFSPTPHFAPFGPSPFLRSPESPFFYPGTSPPTPMPTLDDIIRKGLNRSNSTANARSVAFQKLVGGTEPSTSPSPFGMLARNNTVTGVERNVARQRLLQRLGERVNLTDIEQTSGGEDAPVPLSPKRRRRRSRRNSSRADAVVDDRDPPSTTPTTPLVPPSPLVPTIDNVLEPLPPPPPPRTDALSPSTPVPRRISPAQEQSGEETVVPAESDGQTPTKPRPRNRGSVFVEEDDDDDGDLPPPPSLRPTFQGLPSTPIRGFPGLFPRLPHASTDSTESGVALPVFISQTESTGDVLPASPFQTPIREKIPVEDEEEQVLYGGAIGRLRLFGNGAERELSWIDSPVHTASHFADVNTDAENRLISWAAEPVEFIPIHDDDEMDEDIPDDQRTSDSQSAQNVETHRESSESRELIIETETSPEPTPSYVPPSPSSGAALSHPRSSVAHLSDDSSSPVQHAPTLPVGTSLSPQPDMARSHMDRSFAWEESRPVQKEVTKKRSGEGSVWEKVKNFTRTASGSGRRSRTNSIGTRENRRDHTDSSVSRESGASQTSAKTDKGENLNGIFAFQQGQQAPVMHSPSASASFLALPQVPSRSGVSPIPPASTADLSRYNDAKLNPFPGIQKLEAERNMKRARGMSASASSPDIVSPNGLGCMDQISHSSSNSSTQPARSPESGRDKKLIHQASDTRLLAKFGGVVSPPAISRGPSSASHTDYFTLSPPNVPPPNAGGSMKLPKDRAGVRQWMKIFSSQSSNHSPTDAPPSKSPALSSRGLDSRSATTSRKPSLTDLLGIRKDLDGWEDLGNDKLQTPSTPSSHAPPTWQSVVDEDKEAALKAAPSANGNAVHSSSPIYEPFKTNGINGPHILSTASDIQSLPSPPDVPSSTTPEPFSSVDEYTQSTSESSSNLSSHAPSPPGEKVPSQGAIVMGRLEEMLARGPRSPMWAAAIEDPPRKLIQSSAVLQVANSNTVKDRFLFLFNDILVIAKPMLHDQDVSLDSLRSPALDKKFIVKNVVQLHRLHFTAERDDPPMRENQDVTQPKHPIIRTFIHHFAKDPDHAIAILFDTLHVRDDPVALGQLLFRTIDLDRSRLGEYLAHRTSKVVLRAYVDSFGFSGLRVDRALRAFLQSINIPSRSSSLEYLLDAFASRWYEANAMAFDKDLALRLVRAIVQLNEVLYSGIAQEPGPPGHSRRNVTSRDFVEAFRRCDPRSLVSDKLLEKIYVSIEEERLSQARSSSATHNDTILITTKKPLPSRLTYNILSEPIIVRIPQPDRHLRIDLYGQDLLFDPQQLNFDKSSEASFRVTGTSLGPKTIIMCRSGPNALSYSGLPLSSTIVVERAFMRNTFQVAFLNHLGAKRKYMFSIDDPVWRHQWISSLRRQIEIAQSAAHLDSDTTEGSSRFHRAAESVAFKVLQETLMSSDDAPSPGTGTSSASSVSVIDRALHRFVSSSSPSPRHLTPNGDSPRRTSLYANHSRSKSRSQIYPRHGAGRMEPSLDITNHNHYNHELGVENEDDVDDSGNGVVNGGQQPKMRIWSGNDLTTLCKKNSSIPLVLSYLQVGSPDHESMRQSGGMGEVSWVAAPG